MEEVCIMEKEGQVKSISLNEETIQLCTVVESKEGRYLYFPFWLKETEVKNQFELLNFDALPDDLINEIQNERK